MYVSLEEEKILMFSFLLAQQLQNHQPIKLQLN